MPPRVLPINARPVVSVCLRNKTRNLCVAPRHITFLAQQFPQLQFCSHNNLSSLKKSLDRANVVIAWNFPSAWYARAPKLRAVFTPAAGKDWVHEDPRQKTPVHYGSFHGKIMAQTLSCMMMMQNLRMLDVLRNQQMRKWGRNTQEKACLLKGQSVLIIGYGAIGRECAKILRPFGCRVTGIRRHAPKANRDAYAERVLPSECTMAELRNSDHVVVVLPSGPATDKVLGRRHFRAMKRSAFFYNIGRGNCYREGDLVWALRSKEIAGAGLDVFGTEPLPKPSPLWKLKNVIVMPHSSALTREYMDLYVAELAPKLKKLQLSRP